MEVLNLRWLIDFGLLVMIWMVQLVVYPSFRYHDHEGLLKWHQKYTRQITFIVVPLMMAQLVVASVMLYVEITFFTLIGFLGVVLLFVITGLLFVPIHRAISLGRANEALLSRLVTKNWLRTLIWTLLFVSSSIEIWIKNGC